MNNLLFPEIRMKMGSDGHLLLTDGQLFYKCVHHQSLTQNFEASVLNFIQINLVYQKYIDLPS